MAGSSELLHEPQLIVLHPGFGYFAVFQALDGSTLAVAPEGRRKAMPLRR